MSSCEEPAFYPDQPATGEPETDQAGWERRFYVEPLGKPGDKFTLALPGLRYRDGKHPPRKLFSSFLVAHQRSARDGDGQRREVLDQKLLYAGPYR